MTGRELEDFLIKRYGNSFYVSACAWLEINRRSLRRMIQGKKIIPDGIEQKISERVIFNG